MEITRSNWRKRAVEEHVSRNDFLSFKHKKGFPAPSIDETARCFLSLSIDETARCSHRMVWRRRGLINYDRYQSSNEEEGEDDEKEEGCSVQVLQPSSASNSRGRRERAQPWRLVRAQRLWKVHILGCRNTSRQAEKQPTGTLCYALTLDQKR